MNGHAHGGHDSMAHSRTSGCEISALAGKRTYSRQERSQASPGLSSLQVSGKSSGTKPSVR